MKSIQYMALLLTCIPAIQAKAQPAVGQIQEIPGLWFGLYETSSFIQMSPSGDRLIVYCQEYNGVPKICSWGPTTGLVRIQPEWAQGGVMASKDCNYLLDYGCSRSTGAILCYSASWRPPSVPSDINTTGTVGVGFSRIDWQGMPEWPPYYRGFLKYSSGDVVTVNPVVQSDLSTQLHAVSDNPLFAFGSSGNTLIRWSPQSGVEVLGCPFPGISPRWRDVSADGTYAVGHYDTPPAGTAGFEWDSRFGFKWYSNRRWGVTGNGKFAIEAGWGGAHEGINPRHQIFEPFSSLMSRSGLTPLPTMYSWGNIRAISESGLNIAVESFKSIGNNEWINKAYLITLPSPTLWGPSAESFGWQSGVANEGTLCPHGETVLRLAVAASGNWSVRWEVTSDLGASDWSPVIDGPVMVDGGYAGVFARGSNTTDMTITASPLSVRATTWFRAVVTTDERQVTSANIRVSVCRADYDCSGSVDGDDAIAFMYEWDSGSDSGDFTSDGSVDGDDVIAFFERWDIGC